VPCPSKPVRDEHLIARLQFAEVAGASVKHEDVVVNGPCVHTKGSCWNEGRRHRFAVDKQQRARRAPYKHAFTRLEEASQIHASPFTGLDADRLQHHRFAHRHVRRGWAMGRRGGLDASCGFHGESGVKHVLFRPYGDGIDAGLQGKGCTRDFCFCANQRRDLCGAALSGRDEVFHGDHRPMFEGQQDPRR